MSSNIEEKTVVGKKRELCGLVPPLLGIVVDLLAKQLRLRAVVPLRNQAGHRVVHGRPRQFRHGRRPGLPFLYVNLSHGFLAALASLFTKGRVLL